MRLEEKTKIMQELKTVLCERFFDNIEKVLFFGSQATGNAEEYSDYDVLIVLKNGYDWKLKNEIYSLCYEIDLRYDILLDVKIISKEELASLRGKQAFILNAFEYGISV